MIAAHDTVVINRVEERWGCRRRRKTLLIASPLHVKKLQTTGRQAEPLRTERGEARGDKYILGRYDGLVLRGTASAVDHSVIKCISTFTTNNSTLVIQPRQTILSMLRQELESGHLLERLEFLSFFLIFRHCYYPTSLSSKLDKTAMAIGKTKS
jgi:hypothetical protein